LPFQFDVRLLRKASIPSPEILAHIDAKNQIFAPVARQCSPDTAHGLFGDSERSRRMACNQLRCFLGAALQHGDIRHHLVEQTERQRPGGLDHRAVKIRSLVRAGPTKEASRLIFDIDRQLPSVRAIGKPIRRRVADPDVAKQAAIPAPPPSQAPAMAAIVGTRQLSSAFRAS
jgi:hypothetical protein